MKNESTKTLADYVINRLSSLGLRHIFYLPGGGCMYLIDAIAKSNKLQGIALLHEQSVGIAAEAYSQFTNELSACVVTTGPGATNAITPCAAAWTDSTPVLFISGQVKTEDSADKFGVRQLGFQEIPITEIVKPITKMVVKLHKSMNIEEILTSLISEALGGRPGPVWLDIPLDLQSSPFKVKTSTNKNIVQEYEKSLISIDYSEMISDWKNARRPLVLVGNGVRLANQETQVNELIRITKTPALLTWKMIDFLDDDDPLNAGRPGSIGQRWSNIAQQNSDFILCLGSRLDLGQVAYRLENFAPNAAKYICEVDVNEIKKLPSEFTKYNSNLSFFLGNLLQAVRAYEDWGENSFDWPGKIKFLKEMFPLKPSHEINDKNGINNYDFIENLSKALNKEDILVPGSSGACSETVMQAFKVKYGQRILNSEGLGPMGFGLPAGIGVAFAESGRRVISVDGDGGFMMNIQELTTVAYHKLPILIFLLNNNGYGSIRASQNAYFDGRLFGTDPSSGLGLPNWGSLIQAYGVEYRLIKDKQSMNQLFARFDLLKLPCVVEIIVEPNQKTEPRVSTSRLPNGELLTDSIEDMSPKLSTEKLKELRDFLLS
jgi:acetolactate synthase-1/2/3 large subunit